MESNKPRKKSSINENLGSPPPELHDAKSIGSAHRSALKVQSNISVDREDGFPETLSVHFAPSRKRTQGGDRFNAASTLTKFRLLLWKNYVLQKRRKFQTMVEILTPLLMAFVVVIIRNIIETHKFPQGRNYTSWSPVNITETVIEQNLMAQLGPNPPGLLTVYYTPNAPQISALMNYLQSKFLNFSFPPLPGPMVFTIQPFTTEQQMLGAYSSSSGGVLGAITFKDPTIDDKITYRIRLPARPPGRSSSNSDIRWYTNLVYPTFTEPGPREPLDMFGGVPGYHSQGFIYLQYALDASIIQTAVPNAIIDGPKINNFQISLERFPFPPYVNDQFLVVMRSKLSLFVMLCFIYSYINITKSLTLEKEYRHKESLKMMGLPNYLHWSSWFIKHYAFMIVLLSLILLIWKIQWRKGLAVLPATDPAIIALFLVSYVFSTINFSYFVSTWFSKAHASSTYTGMIWFMTYFPYFFLEPRYENLTQNQKIISCILPNTGMAFGCQLILMFEGTTIGSQWSNFASGASPADNFSLQTVVITLFADGIVCFLFTLYLEGIWPGEYGIPLPWNFPFTKAYWTGSSQLKYVPYEENDTDYTDSLNFEAPPRNMKAGVQIQGLSKQFGLKKAVRNLYLDMYQDQITVLLGHNGAGKTTTMSMLTGLFPPTSGTALINGYDIRTNIKEVRYSLGLCPQHDVLFDELTCEEHLRFFCLMKGCSAAEVKDEIDHMLKALNLEPKRRTQAAALSGGMKRRLSVAIALAGGSKIVLFDEPTSGMDPGARRLTWDFITSEKRNRTILLSTHFMDEADLLGDRIAIMADGQLQTVGSSLFLKKRYGAGYHLVIVKGQGCDVNKITNLIREHLGDAEIEQNVGAELSYSLPDRKSSLFPDMFEELEKRRNELKIGSYGASITTMEEVFMNVGKEVEEKKQSVISSGSLDLSQMGSKSELYKEHKKNTGLRLNIQQIRAMLVKKVLYSIRNWGLFVSQVVISLVFPMLSMIMLKTLPSALFNPNLEVSLDAFSDSVTILSCPSININDPLCNAYDQFGQQLNTRILTIPPGQTLAQYIFGAASHSLNDIKIRYAVGMEKIGNNLTASFNNHPYHSRPLTLNLLMNSLLRHLSSNNQKKIIANNFPLPYKGNDEVGNIGVDSTGFELGFNTVFGMSFLATSFILFLIRERECKAKHLQFVSGAKFTIFWLVNFVFDYYVFVITCVLLIIMIAAADLNTFTETEILSYVFLLLLFYGWGMLPTMYLWSFGFSTPSMGFSQMTIMNIFPGLTTLVLVTLMEKIGREDTAALLDWIFLIIPNYNLGYGLYQLSLNVQLHTTCSKLQNRAAMCSLIAFKDNPCCKKYPYRYLGFHPPGIGRKLAVLFGMGVISSAIIFVLEAKLFQKLTRCFRKSPPHALLSSSSIDITAGDPEEDSDVAAEAERIRTGNLNDLLKSENLILRDLSKSYGLFTAVQCLNLGVQKSECFGLLGVNGAGKTTTFKMITGDFRPTSGNAFICGYSINSQIHEVQKNLGYCPQFDALIDELTGRETIWLIARLRGIREEEINDLANRLADHLLFTEHIDKRVGPYSGGNKRKLSTALALVGNPPVVFLDEPTTGMDPVARRHLWNCIAKVRVAGASIILTSHSMEECEALCTRLVVMVNGQFRCLGSTQHLKSKFGEGYTVIAQIVTKILNNKKSLQESQQRRRTKRLNSSIPLIWELEIEPLKQYIEESFPGSILKDVHPGYVHYHVTGSGLTLGDLFRTMEVAKHKFKLEAYSVGQTSLEQIFLNFAKGQASDE